MDYRYTKREDERFQCNQCSRDFGRPADARRHFADKHSEEMKKSTRKQSRVRETTPLSSSSMAQKIQVGKAGLYEVANCAPELDDVGEDPAVLWEPCTVSFVNFDSSLKELEVNVFIYGEEYNDIPVRFIRIIKEVGRPRKRRNMIGNDSAMTHNGLQPILQLRKCNATGVQRAKIVKCRARDISGATDELAQMISEKISRGGKAGVIPTDVMVEAVMALLNVLAVRGWSNVNALSQLLDALLGIEDVHRTSKKKRRRFLKKANQQDRRNIKKEIKMAVRQVLEKLKNKQLDLGFVRYYSETSVSGRAMQRMFDGLQMDTRNERVLAIKKLAKTKQHSMNNDIRCPELFMNDRSVLTLKQGGQLRYVCPTLWHIFLLIETGETTSVSQAVRQCLVNKNLDFRSRIYSFLPVATTNDGWKSGKTILLECANRLINWNNTHHDQWNVTGGWKKLCRGGLSGQGWMWNGMEDATEDTTSLPPPSSSSSSSSSTSSSSSSSQEQTTTERLVEQMTDQIFAPFGFVRLDRRSDIQKLLLKRAAENYSFILADDFFPKKKKN